jgi:hypothetical protein
MCAVAYGDVYARAHRPPTFRPRPCARRSPRCRPAAPGAWPWQRTRRGAAACHSAARRSSDRAGLPAPRRRRRRRVRARAPPLLHACRVRAGAHAGDADMMRTRTRTRRRRRRRRGHENTRTREHENTPHTRGITRLEQQAKHSTAQRCPHGAPPLSIALRVMLSETRRVLTKVNHNHTGPTTTATAMIAVAASSLPLSSRPRSCSKRACCSSQWASHTASPAHTVLWTCQIMPVPLRTKPTTAL